MAAAPRLRPLTVGLASVLLLGTILYLYTSSFYTPSVYNHSSEYIPASNRFRLGPAEHALRAVGTVTYNWRVTADERRPDGVLKRVYLINDQFPGPTIEARAGDHIVVNVENGLIDEALSLHWHGLEMRGYNRMDGAAGVTQQAIEPGSNFTYSFKTSEQQHGTFWYHAHHSVQRADGLYGGLVLHSEASYNPDQTEYLLMIGDWYHRTADELLKWYLNAESFGMEPVPDSILINGDGVYNCSNAVPARPVNCLTVKPDIEGLRLDRSGHIKLRVINVGAFAGFAFHTSPADFQIVSMDGGNPVDTEFSNTLTNIHPGERFDLLMRWRRHSDSDLSIFMLSKRWKYSNPALDPSQTFRMTGHRQNGIMYDMLELEKHEDLHPSTLEGPIQTPWERSDADMMILLYTMTEKLAHLDYIPTGNINRTIWRTPMTPLIDAAPQERGDGQFIVHIPYNATHPLWVDIVVNNLDEDDHPFHLHGHDFYVMQTYTANVSWGSWNPYETAAPGGDFNSRPLRKDTVVVPRRGYAVLRFLADNPGLWMLHCHVMWHLAGGMAMAFDVS